MRKIQITPSVPKDFEEILEHLGKIANLVWLSVGKVTKVQFYCNFIRWIWQISSSNVGIHSRIRNPNGFFNLHPNIYR